MAESTNYSGGGMYVDEQEESEYIPCADALSTEEASSVIEDTSMGDWDFDISIVAETVVIEDAAAVEAVEAVDHQA